MSTLRRKPRLVIYGIGQYGGFVTRFAVEKGWTIVAAYNRAGPKVGQDLGHAAGLGRDLGVKIQDADTASYAGLDADIGIVATTNILRMNLPAYTRLMNAGLNVICHGAQAYYPYGNDAEAAAEIDTLAKKNRVSFMGGGIWDMSRLWSGLLILGPCTEIKAVHHRSITNAVEQLINAEQAKQVGIGMTSAEYEASGLRNSPVAKMYRTIPEHVLAASGYTIAAKREFLEPVYFDVPVEAKFLGTVPAGICTGSRIIAEVDTVEGATARAEIELRLFKPGEVEYMFWEVDGKPRTRVRVERDDSAHATASNLFNRIRDVIAAPPGIVLASQLGPMRHTALG
jgi:4-hydroxy-tetrahydrodipicolinate reductase